MRWFKNISVRSERLQNDSFRGNGAKWYWENLKLEIKWRRYYENK